MKKSQVAVLCLALAPVAVYAWGVNDLHDFDGADGRYPFSPSSLTQGADGHFYGIVYEGGTAQDGVIFEMVITGTEVSPTVTYSVLHNFHDGTVSGDGINPRGSMVEDASGNYYGVTTLGGSTPNLGYGVVFKFNPSTGVTIIHNFGDGSVTNDGERPSGGLIIDSSGNLYGTTSEGGAHGDGTIFKMSQSGGVWTETIYHSFAGGTEGANPAATLAMGTDGKLYGTTFNGGSYSAGTAFQFSLGTLTTIYSFTYPNSPSFNGLTQVTPSSSIEFFGTTPAGGTHSLGSIYSLTQETGHPTVFSYSVVRNFAGGSDDGEDPTGNLLVTSANGGSFYGVSGGGPAGTGIGYNITFGGTFTDLFNLPAGTTEGAAYGIINSTSVLMGTTEFGGANSDGSVWEAYLQ